MQHIHSNFQILNTDQISRCLYTTSLCRSPDPENGFRSVYAPLTPIMPCKEFKNYVQEGGYLKNSKKDVSLYTHFETIGVPAAVPACENSATVAQKLLRLSLSNAPLAPFTVTMLVAALVDNPYR